MLFLNSCHIVAKKKKKKRKQIDNIITVSLCVSVCVSVCVYLYMEIQSKKRETSPIGLYLSFFPPRHQNKECLWFINHWPSTVTRIHNSKPLHYQIEGQVFSFCPYFYIITTSSVHGNNQQSNLEGLEHLPFRKGQPLTVSTLCLC